MDMVAIIALITIIGIFIAYLVYASYYIGSGVYIKAICKLKTQEPFLALTFDDGPDAKNTPQILEILEQENIKAVFFCIGEKIQRNEKLLEQIVSKGHLIGNHSYSHTSKFPLLSLKKMKTDLEKCEVLINNITHQEKLSLFRPPFGVTNPTIKKATKYFGYKTLGWNIRSLDTSITDSDKVVKRINKKIKNGSIILLHDTTPEIQQILKKVITFAKQNGYSFVRADQYI